MRSSSTRTPPRRANTTGPGPPSLLVEPWASELAAGAKEPDGAAAALERDERPPRNARGGRPERAPRVDSISATGVVQPFVDTIPVPDPEGTAPEGEARDGRRRRRRGGRDRGEGRASSDTPQISSDGADGSTVNADTSAAPPASTETAEGSGERERGRRRGRGRDRDRDETREARPEPAAPSDPTPVAHAIGSETAAEHLPLAASAATTSAATSAVTSAATVAATPTAPIAAAFVATVDAAPPAPISAARPTVPAAVSSPAPVLAAPPPIAIEPFALPTHELASLATSAGLEWVQSDTAKIDAVRAAMAAEPLPARVPREPRSPVVVDDGPLVLVETRKDLSQLKLPFEQQAH